MKFYLTKNIFLVLNMLNLFQLDHVGHTQNLQRIISESWFWNIYKWTKEFWLHKIVTLNIICITSSSRCKHSNKRVFAPSMIDEDNFRCDLLVGALLLGKTHSGKCPRPDCLNYHIFTIMLNLSNFLLSWFNQYHIFTIIIEL